MKVWFARALLALALASCGGLAVRPPAETTEVVPDAGSETDAEPAGKITIVLVVADAARPPDSADAAPGAAPVANRGFDWDLSGWQVELGSSASWDRGDAKGSARSGSLVLTNMRVGVSEDASVEGVRQCLPIEPAAAYRLAAAALIPNGQAGGAAGVELQFFASRDCSAPTAGPSDTLVSRLAGTWTLLEGRLTTPPGAASATLRLVAVKPYRQGPFTVRFDDVRLDPL
jgi:hypothetical protein